MYKRTDYNVDDESIRLADINYGRARYSLGRAAMVQLAEDANAVVRIGKLWRFSPAVVDAYLAKTNGDTH